MEYWLSPAWFTISTLQSFVWQRPAVFFLIPAVPFLFILRWLLHTRFRQKLQVAIPAQRLRWSPVSLLRFIPDILMGLSIILVIIALARPQRQGQRVELYSEGIDIMLLLDVSESMLLEDFKPNRLQVAKNVAREFIKGRFQDRIGIIVFSGDAYSLAPLTTDYNLLYEYINEIKYGMITSEGTAIGSALAVSVNRMRDSDSKTKVGILISDGDNTAGNIDPITAAQLAQVYGIKLYSIAVGSDRSLPTRDANGVVRQVENTIDERTLRQIAEIGEGKFFRASNDRSLQEVFTLINQYEKAEVKEVRFVDTKDFYLIYLRWAILFLMLWLLSKSTFVSNILED